MPDRCEVLPGDSVVARRGGGLLWVDAPGSPALVAALHACLGVAGPGAERVLGAVAGQVSALGGGSASFALVLVDTAGGTGTGVALWSGKGQPAVDGVPVSGSSVDGCTLASGFQLGQALYVGPGQPVPSMPPGVAYDLVEGTVPGSGAMLQLAAVAHASSAAVPQSASSFTAGSDAGFGSAGSSGYGATAAPAQQQQEDEGEGALAQPRVLGSTPTAQPRETVRTARAIRLAPGRYRLACTIANHDTLGQYGTLIVTR